MSNADKPFPPTVSATVEFPDNRRLTALFGPHNVYLAQMEATLGVTLASRGNRVVVDGPEACVQRAEAILQHAYERLEQNLPWEESDVQALLNTAETGVIPVHTMNVIKTRLRPIYPKTPAQQAYMTALTNHELVLGVGPAGTGKTYLATAMGVSLLLSGQVRRLILTRPAVEAGEKLGFLPGDMREKIDPYLRPLFDALREMMSNDAIERALACQDIEIAPLAFMRGRTLSHAYIILDEAQNTTSAQMKMVLTRLGTGSRMVVNGDLSQVDLPRGVPSGLEEAVQRLQKIPAVATVRFNDKDVIRHPLVAEIIRAYEHNDDRARMP